MKHLSLALILLFNAGLAAGQVTFTHTTDADFNKGIAENVLIKNNSVSLPNKKGSINDWTSTTNLPQNLTGHRMASWRNFVYLSGGYNGSVYNNYVYRATVNTTGISGWTQLGNLPENVAFHAMVATGTRLYILGGKTTGDPSNKIYSATINDDGSLGSWSLQSITLPIPLWGHTATLVNGFLYISGGGQLAQTNSAQNGVWYSAINALDELTPLLAGNSLPEARNGHSMAKYDGKLYILGGYDNTGVKKATVYYTTVNPNGSCGAWSQATPLPAPVSNHVSTCSNGMITVIGGEESTILSNKFYYADVDNATLTWELSDKYLYDRAKNSAAVSTDNQIIYAGGSIPTGALVSTIRYVQLIPSTTMVKKGIYLSAPFVVGSPKNIQKLTYNLILQSGDSFELLYRLAGVNKTWGNWVSAGSANPAMINQENSYIQYMVRFNASASNDITLNDLTLTVSGYTQLSGNLNAMSSLTAAASPYWATGNITFTAGSHIIQPGVTIVFSPNTGLEIGQASVSFNGNQAQPIRLTSFDSTDGQWNGVYFNDASDAGVSSQMNYTTIERAGYGAWDANLYCYSTNQPVVNNCTFRKAMGHGVRMESSNFILNNTTISYNETNGLYLNASNPILNNVVTKNNGYAGIYYASGGLNPSYSMTRSENNTYGLFSPTPDVSFIPESATTLLFQNNGSDIAVNGGNIHSSRVWKYFPNGYTVLGNITIYQNSGNPTLTIGPGTRVKFVSGSGLYIGAGSNQGGQLYAVGTTDSLITFTAANGLTGGWTGLYFNDGSDYNSTSSLRYCVVEKGNEYNVFSVNSIEPHIMFTTIRNSVTYGVKLQNASINIEETTIKNAQHGLYLDNSAPSLILTMFDSITTYCVFRANDGANPNFSQCTMKNSLYGIYYPHPNYTVPTYSSISFINLKASVTLNGGDISTDQTWNYNPLGYALLENIYVRKCCNGPKLRLTIKSGITLKFAKGKQLQVGYSDNYGWGGELYAIGTAENKIIFTALNDSTGGWNGIYFHNHSDEYASTSNLKNCIIEKTNAYGIWCNSTSQPSIDSCFIRNSFGIGLLLESAPISMTNSSVFNNGGIGINSTNSLLNISNLDIQNNVGYGIYYNNAYYVNNLKKIQLTGNGKDAVVIAGGDISENRIWSNFGSRPYIITENVYIRKCCNSPKSRLTIHPGVTVKFAKGKQLQVGYSDNYGWGGELFAIGKPDSIILFSPINDSVGGWNGIYFHNHSDEYTSTSNLKNCIIEKTNTYGIWCNSTSQPLIDSCIIRNSYGMGLHLESAPLTFKNSTIVDNGSIGINSINSLLNISNLLIQNNIGYGIYYNNAYYVNNLKNIQLTGNSKDAVVIAGGDVSENRVWSYFGNNPYIITENVYIRKCCNSPKSRLTIQPGVTVKFAKGKHLQVGYSDNYGWGGELYAIGNQDSIITFNPINDSVGGWNGIYFHNFSDEYGSISSLKYISIQKSSQYNIWCNNTTQPLIENCIIERGAGYGLWLDAANVTVKNSVIRDHLGYGLYLTAGSNPVIGNNFVNACDIFNNSYNIFNNTGNNINMRYNFLGSCDSSYIAGKVWDKSDNSGLGRITFTPFSWLPVAQQNAINVSGKFLYDNNLSKPLRNAVLTLKDQSNNNTIATAQTNSSGSFSFAPLTLNVPTNVQFTLNDQFGGVNATDAQRVMQHFTYTTPPPRLDANHTFVADVNKSSTVNGTDAMMILQRFANVITSFPTGNLQVDCDSVILTNPGFTYNLSALWFGDVNGSYNTLSKSPGIGMVYEGAIYPGSWQEFTMRVKIKNKVELGAISHTFLYPPEFLEVLGVTLMRTGTPLIFTAQEGILRTGWYSLDPIQLTEEEVFLLIRFKTKDLSTQTLPISIALGDENELTDGFASPHQGVILSVPVIPVTITGLGREGNGKEEQFAFRFFPNPAREFVTFSWTMPKTGLAKIVVSDAYGREVALVPEQTFKTGENQQILSLPGISAGVYFIRFFIEGEQNARLTRKLIVQ